MARVKSENRVEEPLMRPALSPEARENQLIALAMDRAEEQLRAGTASSALIVELVKRGATKYRLENEKLKEENELLKAKTEALQQSARIEELYENAIKAMRGYAGFGDEEEEFDD